MVCDKAMRVVAAIDMNDRTSGMGAAADVKAQCLDALGIPLLRVNPAALPRREEVRNLIFSPRS